MASSVIGSLRVNLGLDSAKFQRGMTEAQKSLASARKNFMAVSTVAASAAGAIAGLTLVVGKSATEIRRFADVANTTPQVLQRWSIGSKTVGIEQEKLSDILKDVNDRVGDFLTTGGGPMADFFENIAPQVGITAEAFRNLSGPQALQLFVSSLEKANLSQAEMTFYMEAMASDSTLLLPLLRDNATEMNRLADSSASLGAVLSNEAVASLDSMNLAVSEAVSSLRGMGNIIAVAAAPAIQNLAVAFTNSMREGGLLRRIIDGLVGAFDGIAIAVSGVVVSLGVKYITALVASTTATGIFTTALAVARAAVIALGGPLGIVWGLIGAAGAAWLIFRDNTDKAATEVFATSAAMRELNGLLGTFYETAAPSAGQAAIEYANNMREQAKAVRDAARAEIALQEAELARFQNADPMGREGGVLMGDAEERALQGNLEAMRGELSKAQAALDEAERAAKQAVTAVTGAMSEGMTDATDATKELAVNVDLAMSGLSGGAAAAIPELEKITPVIDGATDAFKDFARDGIGQAVDWMVDGFAGGLKTLKQMFIDTIKQMIAYALKNKIMIGLGLGGSSLGTAASAGGSMIGGAGILGGIGTFASSIGTGLSVVGSGFAAGGLGGAATATMGAISGGIGAGGAVGFGTAIGAALPVLGVAALAIGLFSKKIKQLDSGLSVAIKGMDTAVQTFSKIQTSKFFGLSKKTSTSYRNDPNNPLVGAVSSIQNAVADAALVFGFGARTFDDFTYKFKLSLKGLSEEDKLKKINEELAKMGDQFAQIVPNMADMNDLLEKANQAVMDTAAMGSTRFESQILAAARRRGEVTLDRAGVGFAEGQSLVRLQTIENEATEQKRVMTRMLSIFEGWEIDGMPIGPTIPGAA